MFFAGIVIDGMTSILGSHNWSASGLTRNSESSVLVRSQKVAGVFGRCFAEAWSKGNGVTGVAERQRRVASRRRKLVTLGRDHHRITTEKCYPFIRQSCLIISGSLQKTGTS